MKKQTVFVFTELYGNDSDTEVNVLGVYATKTMAKDMFIGRFGAMGVNVAFLASKSTNTRDRSAMRSISA